MAFALLEGDEAARLFDEKLASRDWWVFLGELSLLRELEERVYVGDAERDFQLFFGPPVGEFAKAFPDVRFLPVVFAHKRRLPDTDLARFLSDHGQAISAEELEVRDILFLGSADD